LETHFQQNVGTGYDPKLLPWFTMGFSFKSTYNEDWDRGTKSRHATASRAYGVNGKFDHKLLLAGKGGQASGSAGRRTARQEREEKRRKALEDQKKADTTAAKADKNDEKKNEKKKGDGDSKPVWKYPLDAVRFATGWINPVTYSINQSFGSNYPRLSGRPSWRFIYGIDKEPAHDLLGQAVIGLSRSRSKSWNADFGSGFSAFKGLNVDVRFQQSVSEDIEKQGTLSRSTSRNFPDLTIRITQFKGVPYVEKYINKFIQTFTPRTDYRREERWTEDLESGFEISRSRTTAWAPLLSVNFKVMRNLALNGNYNTSKEVEVKNNPDNGKHELTSTNTRNSLGISTSYSFSSPGGIRIPLFGRLKFRSTVKIDFDAKKNSSKSESTSSGVAVDNSDLTFATNVSYSFSQQVSGGLRGKWTDARDNKIDRNTHIRELALWARITF
jgi:hypothetical protein